MLKWLKKKLANYRTNREMADHERHDFAAMEADLRKALTLLENAKEQARDSNYCKEMSWQCEALELVRLSIGQRVWPGGLESHYFASLWQIIFGYKSPARPHRAGMCPICRLREDREQGLERDATRLRMP